MHGTRESAGHGAPAREGSQRETNMFSMETYPSLFQVPEDEAMQQLFEMEDKCKVKAAAVLEMINNEQFREKYAIGPDKQPDVYAISCMTTKIAPSISLYFECFANVTKDQIVKFKSYEFASHPFFENTITKLTKIKDKPNTVLMRTRPWDVAYCMVLKVEAVETEDQKNPTLITLNREYHILKNIWDHYTSMDSFDMEDLTGIPIVFDYAEVTNECFNYDRSSITKIDIGGNIDTTHPKSPVVHQPQTSLSYMTMEKLGPSVRYLLQIMGNNDSGIPIFTFDTAFKIFDQLICRLMQIHRAGVVHHNVAPEHVHFGRQLCMDVVYLSHFKSAIQVAHQRERPMFLGNERFGSLSAVKNQRIHPYQDLESAFYFLLAMIRSTLPWDLGMLQWNQQFYKSKFDETDNRNNPRLNDSIVVQLNPYKKHLDPDLIQRQRDMKSSFWKNPKMIKKIIQQTDIEHIGSDKFHIAIAGDILLELYYKMKDSMQDYSSSNKDSIKFCHNLAFSTSKEFAIYNDIRRIVLIFFKFQSHSDWLTDMSYQNKETQLKQGDKRKCWDLSVWCFSNMEVNANR